MPGFHDKRFGSRKYVQLENKKRIGDYSGPYGRTCSRKAERNARRNGFRIQKVSYLFSLGMRCCDFVMTRRRYLHFRFVLDLILVYERTFVEDFAVALEEIKKLENRLTRFKTESEDKFFVRVSAALNHIVVSCKVHLLMNLNSLDEANEVSKSCLRACVSSFRFRLYWGKRMNAKSLHSFSAGVRTINSQVRDGCW